MECLGVIIVLVKLIFGWHKYYMLLISLYVNVHVLVIQTWTVVLRYCEWNRTLVSLPVFRFVLINGGLFMMRLIHCFTDQVRDVQNNLHTLLLNVVGSFAFV